MRNNVKMSPELAAVEALEKAYTLLTRARVALQKCDSSSVLADIITRTAEAQAMVYSAGSRARIGFNIQ